ncbi:MAG: hypothetical protein Q9190_003470 [Brigantiaea leucoxantha]
MACPLSDILNSSPDVSMSSASESSESSDSDSLQSFEHRTLEGQPNNPSTLPSSVQGQSDSRLGLRSPPPSPAPAAPPGSDPPPQDPSPNSFSIFQSLLSHAELVFELAKHLDIEDLISLYAISRDFHFFLNRRFTTTILSQSVSRAAESSRIFKFRCYRSLCIRDPARRRLNNTNNNNAPIRYVPSFRWLRMILFRERVVTEILSLFSAEGLRLPPSTSLAIKKLWFVTDIADNQRRMGVMHTPDFWTPKDLFLASMFIIKLDMLLTDPMRGEGDPPVMREMLLAQRSLSTLWRVLKREELTRSTDVLRMLVEWRYSPPRPGLGLPIMGVMPRDVGRLQWEGWGRNRSVKMLQLDWLVAMECVRRGYDVQQYHLDMMLHGFVDRLGVGMEDVWSEEQVRSRVEREGGDLEAELEHARCMYEREDRAFEEITEEQLREKEGGDGGGLLGAGNGNPF